MVPFSYDIRKGGTYTDEEGHQGTLVRLVIMDATGSKIVFMPAPSAIQMSEVLREVAGGLTIAQTIEGIEL